MVVKLGVLKLESHQQIQLSRVLQFYILCYSYFKSRNGSFSSKAKTPSMVLLSNIASILLFKSSSESVRRIISSLEYYHLKLLNTLPLLIYQHLNYLLKTTNVFFCPKSINRCVEFKAESKSSITLSHSIPSAVLSNITIGYHH
jgi:hypothetical protein